MAERRKRGEHTPEFITNQMVKKIKAELQGYDGHSNAYLAEIDYVDGPVWVIDLYNGRITHRAILEEICDMDGARILYIYAGPLKPRPIIDLGQVFERHVVRDGRDVKQIGEVYSNKRLEPCIRWTTAAVL